MSQDFRPAPGAVGELDLLRVGVAGKLAQLLLNRPGKRNAVNDRLLLQLEFAMNNLPEGVQAVVLQGLGDHFCAGLDLSELSERSVADGVRHSRMWHRVMDSIQFGPVPVIAVLHGAVVGGGLEIASSCHLRVAERSTYYGLPEGRRGIFVGGGGAARIPRLVGVALMTDMMLTGRTIDAEDGYRWRMSQYLVEIGAGQALACELAGRIADNAPLSNFAITQALPRIADMPATEGMFLESLVAAIAQGDEAAKSRLTDFLEKRAAKVEHPAQLS